MHHHNHDNSKYAELSADGEHRNYMPLEDLKPHQLAEITDGRRPPDHGATPMDQDGHQSSLLAHQQHHHQQPQLPPSHSSHRIAPSNYAEYHPQHSLAHVPVSSLASASDLAPLQSSESMCLQLPSFDYQLSDGTLHAGGGSSSYYDLSDAAMHSVQYDLGPGWAWHSPFSQTYSE